MARVAILVSDGFDDEQVTHVRTGLEARAHEVVVVAPGSGPVVGEGDGRLVSDRSLEEADPAEFDALVVPGGSSPDELRPDEAAVVLVSGVAARGVPVVAIGQGCTLLIEAGQVRHRTVTSVPSIRTDLVNAGADWIDEDVVIDANIITCAGAGELGPVIAALDHQLAENERTAEHP